MSQVKISLRENSTTTQGTTQNDNVAIGGAYLLLSQSWTVRPSDSAAFTKADIDTLEIGISLIDPVGANNFCTQVYVVVDYTPRQTSQGLINGA